MRLVRYTYPNYRSFTPAASAFARSSWPSLEQEIDRLFGNALGNFANGTSYRLPVDLYEDKQNTYVRAELPGVVREDIAVEVVDGNLSIKANRKSPAQGEQPEASTEFSRTVALSDEVQADKVSAAYENGVLTVTLPKREEIQPRKVTVAVK